MKRLEYGSGIYLLMPDTVVATVATVYQSIEKPAG